MHTDDPAPRPDRPAPAPRARVDTVPWRQVGLFALLATGMFAVFALPFWILDEGIAHLLYSLVIGVGMLTPTVASLILARGVERTSWRTRVGLRFRGRWRSLLLWIPLSVVLVLGIHLAGAVVMVLRGVPGDLSGRTWLEITSALLSETLGTEVGVATVIAFTLVALTLNVTVTTLSTLGEEIGWRGWLWPALRPLGVLRGSVVGGVIWSLWHLPIVLIGHNYPGAPRPAAIAMFAVACIAMSFLFGAITERAQGNPIPAGVAHAVVNAALGTVLALVATTETMTAMNPFVDTVLGATGVVLLLAVGAAVMPWGRLRREDAERAARREAGRAESPAATA